MTGTKAPSHEQDYGAGYDEHGLWHCSDCWEEYCDNYVDPYGTEADNNEEAEDWGEEVEGETGSWCTKCDTFFPDEFADFGWQEFVCAECTEESASGSAPAAAKRRLRQLTKRPPCQSTRRMKRTWASSRN